MVAAAGDVGRVSFTEAEVEALARQDLQRRMKDLKLDLAKHGLAEESQSLPSFGPDSAGRRGHRGKGQSLVGPATSARGPSSQRRTSGDDGFGGRAPRSSRESASHSNAEQLRELGTCKVGDSYRVMKKVMVRAGPELDSPRLSVLGGGEVITVLETWQSREGQLRVRCEAGWTSIYSKDGLTRLLQKTAGGARSPPGSRAAGGGGGGTDGAYVSRRSASPPSADTESTAYDSPGARSPVRALPLEVALTNAARDSAQSAAPELSSPIRTGVPLPSSESSSSPGGKPPLVDGIPGDRGAAPVNMHVLDDDGMQEQLVLQEMDDVDGADDNGADDALAGVGGSIPPPIAAAGVTTELGSPATPEIPLPLRAGAAPTLPPPLAPA